MLTEITLNQGFPEVAQVEGVIVEPVRVSKVGEPLFDGKTVEISLRTPTEAVAIDCNEVLGRLSPLLREVETRSELTGETLAYHLADAHKNLSGPELPVQFMIGDTPGEGQHLTIRGLVRSAIQLRQPGHRLRDAPWEARGSVLTVPSIYRREGFRRHALVFLIYPTSHRLVEGSPYPFVRIGQVTADPQIIEQADHLGNLIREGFSSPSIFVDQQ